MSADHRLAGRPPGGPCPARYSVGDVAPPLEVPPFSDGPDPTDSADPQPSPPPWGPATGIGSLPGTDPAEALRTVLGELPDLPHLPELPARGPGADMIGRTAALLVDLFVDLTPAGWRLVPRPGIDLRRAHELLERAGLPVEYHESDAAHHIDPAHVPAAVAWLRETV